MTTRSKDNRILIVLLILLAMSTVAVSVWAYSVNNKNQALISDLDDEKQQIELELENLGKEYTAQIDQGNALTADLKSARSRINQLRDSVSDLEPNVAILKRLRRELVKIKDQKIALETRVSILEGENLALTQQQDSTLQLLNAEMLTNNLRASQLDSLNISMARAGALIPTNFTPTGVIVRSSGKQKENDRARRVDDVKVCFTVPENPLAAGGITTFFLQVINPDNNVLGAKKRFTDGEQELIYSKDVRFNYKNKELDLCELVGANEDNIIKGRYRINLYNGAIRISSSELELR